MVEVLRGEHVESFHRGAWAVVDAGGVMVASGGDIERPIFPRSAVKVLQALPLVASGAADHFGLDDAALALACASHGGEPEHVAVAGQVLAQLGLDERTLECGAHWPGFEPAKLALARTGEEPHPLHNNCSGKHAGFACLGCWLAKGQGQEFRGFLSNPGPGPRARRSRRNDGLVPFVALKGERQRRNDRHNIGASAWRSQRHVCEPASEHGLGIVGDSGERRKPHPV